MTDVTSATPDNATGADSGAAYPDTRLFIDGQWGEATDGRTLNVRNPSNGRVIGTVAHASIADLDRALEAADRGFRHWRDQTPAQRAAIMRTASGLMRERADRIAHVMTLEQGKPVREAKGEILAAADIVDWFADEGLRVYGRLVPSRFDVTVRQMVLKEPVGPVAAFTPWNFPVNQVVRKVSAALASGCSMIIKAPEETPASPAALVQAFVDAGIPAGVLGLVYGDPAEISGYLIPHPVIRKITFTGSTAVGKQLASLAGQHMKRTSMELGGHAPVIVCDDADIEVALRSMGPATFRNAGQVCISPTRFLVQDGIREEFSRALAEYAGGLRVGDGLAEETQMGPLANERRITAMTELHSDAVGLGARVLAGGERLDRDGNFWAPTVLDDVSTGARIFNEEPFGPVAAVRGFDRVEEAIDEANRLAYGLAAYAFTGSLARTEELTRGIEVGMLWINMAAAPSAELPFGGLKDSGHGSEGGPEAMESYLNTRTVAIKSA